MLTSEPCSGEFSFICSLILSKVVEWLPKEGSGQAAPGWDRKLGLTKSEEPGGLREPKMGHQEEVEVSFGDAWKAWSQRLVDWTRTQN